MGDEGKPAGWRQVPELWLIHLWSIFFHSILSQVAFSVFVYLHSLVMAYVCAVCGTCQPSKVGRGMRVEFTDENGWITHGKICATCIRLSWRDHTKLEITPKNNWETHMQCTEFIENLKDFFVLRWHIPTTTIGSLWVGY